MVQAVDERGPKMPKLVSPVLSMIMLDCTFARCALMSPWMTGAFMVALSLGIHLAPQLNSQLSMSNEEWNPEERLVSDDYMAYLVEVHRSVEPAFAKRPVTTGILDALAATDMPLTWAFILIGFGLVLIAGVLVRYCALSAGLSIEDAWRAQVIFHLLPTIFFLYFAPIYSYDEPLQYVLLLLALRAFLTKRFLLFTLLLSMAMLARETSLLLFPSFAWLLWNGANEQQTTIKRWARIIMLAAPLTAYVIFLWLYLPHAGLVEDSGSDLAGRLQFFDENFKNGDMAGESLCFAFLALGLPCFLLARYALGEVCTPEHLRWIKAFLIALVLNTAVVFAATKAREARLFALPLLLVLPLLGRVWSVELARHGGWGGMFRFMRQWHYVLLFGLFAGILVLITEHVFILSDGVPSENLFHEYFLAQSLFMACCILSDAHRRERHALRPH